jgi:hypothetical protein
MTTNWLTIDPVTYLGLDKEMTPEEIEDFLGVLEKEIWYRVLEEELPKQVAKSDYTYIANSLAPKHDLNLIVGYIKSTCPTVPIEEIIEKTVIEVKKEFAEKYNQIKKPQ